jgi:endonuclease YncB( thermonuclease family)
MVSVWAFLVHLLFVSTALAADFTGPVVSVLDGDTFEVLHNRRAERIRLTGPEKGPSYDTRRLYAEYKRADQTSICRTGVP